MKIMIFLHGTTIMHKEAIGHAREEIVKQSKGKMEPSLFAFKSYVPIKNAAEKIETWKDQGAEIVYLSSHRFKRSVEKDRFVLKNTAFLRAKFITASLGSNIKISPNKSCLTY